jgi:hypothetical protein
MTRDSHEVAGFDIAHESGELLERATMLSAVIHDRLQTIGEHGAMPEDEATFSQVADRLQEVVELGVTAVRSVDETDFSVRQPEVSDRLELDSSSTFQLVCQFVRSQKDNSFQAADLQDFLTGHGADETDIAKNFSRAFGKWRNRILGVAHEQGASAQWVGPTQLGRGKYALATGGNLEFLK